MTNVNVRTKPFNAANYIETAEDAVAVINDALQSGDSQIVASTLGVIARSRGASALAKAAGVSRASLYNGLSDTGNPTLSVLMSVLKELGLELRVKEPA